MLLKNILAFGLFLLVSNPLCAQLPTEAQAKEAITKVLTTYKDALEHRTVDGTFELFSADSQIFEQGGQEGTYANYIAHHLGPELAHINRFEFSDYTLSIELALPYAFTTETYVYLIEIASEPGKDPRRIHRKGIATSVLRYTDGAWLVIKMHSSSRDKK